MSTVRASAPAGLRAQRRSVQGGPPDLSSSRPRRGEQLVRLLLRLAAYLSIAITLGIVISLLLPALEFFREVSVVEFLTGTRWAPQFADPTFGVLPLVTATFWTTGIALAVAVPFGLGAAIYLAEYARDRVRRVLKPILEILAGIPTVVLGFFALTWVAPVVLKEWFGIQVGTFSILAAGLVMGVMIIPTVASLSEDAMSAVPQALRQGSAALGANRMQTSLRVVVPAALSGIVAAIVLGISRAIGETMIVAIAAGARPQMVTDPTMEGATMTGFIARMALGDARVGSLQYNTLFAVGLLLFVLTLVVNLIAIRLVRRFRQAY
ncbi:phosphate ABC transporter permease subunit PstC [Cellulomonas septica]|uniref:Phosphate transport system permease protein n=1 Tax=Cellulomonas septica TaxID=285080 RepID=A0ABX1JUJ0_9CELL|nr:phosphate ABC transporter permease subunit PstC [Cellulomonas septica]NKY37973.1 phosphate ABC transporter permease subunit PstC [Cellulomonas septica]